MVAKKKIVSKHLYKEISLKLIGFEYEIDFIGITWNGEKVTGEGNRYVTKNLLTHEQLISELNDGGFGLESMIKAKVYVYAMYQHPVDQSVYTRMFYKIEKFNSQECAKAKLGI